MAREILFKAKRIDNGEWIEGSYVKSNAINEYARTEAYILACDDEMKRHLIYIYESTICQYTGLTDKNGNKIWENDIVKQENIGLLGTIVWTNGMFCIDDVYDGLQDYMEFIGQTEVIGNKFDNPELLEVLS